MKRFVILLVLIALAAVLRLVRQRAAPPVSSGGEGWRLQAPLGDKELNWANLSFAITAIRRDQKMLDAPPWFAPGGSCTVIDCAASDDPTATFTVALETGTPDKSDVPVAFAHAILLPPTDKQAGARMLSKFAKAFRQEPPPARTPQPLAPLRMTTAVLGEGIRRDPKGGFGGGRGTWTATKWFPTAAGYEAEVFFNYDLANATGEFSEKDPDYREDLLSVLAIVLRDGPRVSRTPQTDPNLAADGPRIEDLRLVPGSGRGSISFLSDGKHVVLISFEKATGSEALAVPLDQPDKPISLVRIGGRILDFRTIDGDLQRFVCEEVLEPDTFGTDTPRRLWLFDRSRNQKRRIEGPWGDHGEFAGPDPAVISPGGRYIGVTQWEKPPAAQKGRHICYVFDTTSGSAVRLDLPADHAEFVAWRGEGSSLRAVLQTGFPFDKKEPRETLLVDPVTGACEKASDDVLPHAAAADSELSPDGKRRFKLTPRRHVDITDVDTGLSRRFTFHEDDRAYAGEESLVWLSPRYIAFDTAAKGFIDSVTMKQSYLPGVKAGQEHVQYSRDFRWAAISAEDGVRIGRVIVPAEDGVK